MRDTLLTLCSDDAIIAALDPTKNKWIKFEHRQGPARDAMMVELLKRGVDITYKPTKSTAKVHDAVIVCSGGFSEHAHSGLPQADLLQRQMLHQSSTDFAVVDASSTNNFSPNPKQPVVLFFTVKSLDQPPPRTGRAARGSGARGAPGPLMSDPGELNARLRRLRRDVPRSAGTERTEGTQLSAAARRQLARRTRRASVSAAAYAGEPFDGPRTVGPPEELERRTNALGSFAVRIRRFSADHLHGAWRLDEVDQARVEDVCWSRATPRCRSSCCATRSTSTSRPRGSPAAPGTIPFMIAWASSTGRASSSTRASRGTGTGGRAAPRRGRAHRATRRPRQFLRQVLRPSPPRGQMRIHGVDPPFADRPHLDLYHPLRRLYGGAWDDGRLGTCERELCGVERTDDLSGRYAPEACSTSWATARTASRTSSATTRTTS